MRERLARQWKAFLPHLKETPLRFPLAFACALAFTVFLILSTHDLSLLGDEEILGRILWFCVIAFFLFLAGQLLGESRGWPRLYTILLSLAAGGLLAWRVATAEIDSFWSSGLNLFLAPACVLAVMAAPFIKARHADDALWHFNRLAWFGCSFGILAGLVLGGGVSGAFWALDALFGAHIPGELYGDVWTLSLALLAPWLALAAIPRSYAAPETAADRPLVPRPIAFLSSYILIPLAIAYFAILYAFMVKIVVLWDLPKGEVALLIMGYAAFGVAAHLIAYPLNETGPWHVRRFHRWFYPALVVPAGLLALAIGVRVAAYGVTEDRYLVMAFAAWLLLLAPFMTLRPRTGLKAAPLSLAVLLALGSFGPWGAEDVSETSQMARLEELLTRNDILKDGRIAPVAQDGGGVPREDVIRISSIVTYLRNSGKHQAMAPWFAASGLDFATDPYAKNIVEAMGLNYLLYDVALPGFHFYAQQTASLAAIEGFERIGRVQLYAYNDQPWRSTLGPDAAGESYDLSFDPTTGRFVIQAQDGAALAFDLKAFVARLSEEGPSRAVDDLTLEESEAPLRVRLMFQDLSGTLDGPRIRIQAGNVLVLIDRTDR
jgi:Domain of unknown function (DUF4153)